MSPSQVENLLKKKQRKRESRELRAAEGDLGKCRRWSDPALGEQTEHVSLLIIFIMIIDHDHLFHDHDQVNKQNTLGWAPLLAAASRGHIDIVNSLLECNARSR